jgi:hypothetical protein
MPPDLDRVPLRPAQLAAHLFAATPHRRSVFGPSLVEAVEPRSRAGVAIGSAVAAAFVVFACWAWSAAWGV